MTGRHSLRTGLYTGLAGFEDDQPYLACGDSTPQRYIVDGEMQRTRALTRWPSLIN